MIAALNCTVQRDIMMRIHLRPLITIYNPYMRAMGDVEDILKTTDHVVASGTALH